LSIREILLQDSFFSSLPDEYLEFLENNAIIAKYSPGKYLFHEGTQSQKFYYIVSGKVALELHMPAMQNISFETVPKGHFVGWSWLFPPHTWVFDGRAVREVEAISFDAMAIREEAEKDHEFGFILYKYFSTLMSHRILSSRMQLMDIYQQREGKEFL